MVEKKAGKVIYRYAYSPILQLFRMVPEDGSEFPEYKAGQYIALSRDNCRLTKRITGPDGEVKFAYDLDPSGAPRRGTVTHSYSISSAPYETAEKGYLEFYVVLEMMETGIPGRLSESLFSIEPENDCKLTYMNKITGDFTLDKRASGFPNVVLVGTGSGLAPFASMIKDLHRKAMDGNPPSARFTLFHANRTYEELGYHDVLRSIEAARKFDFVYVPSVSRPTSRDVNDPQIGKGRANNLLRSVLGMPLKEAEDLQQALERGDDPSKYEKMLEQTVRPILPDHLSHELLLERMEPDRTVILTCGNPKGMEDIKRIAAAAGLRFEKEDW
jgi:ferredoxin-NADP reductase